MRSRLTSFACLEAHVVPGEARGAEPEDQATPTKYYRVFSHTGTLEKRDPKVKTGTCIYTTYRSYVNVHVIARS